MKINPDGSVTILKVDPESLTGYINEGFHGEHNPDNAGEQKTLTPPSEAADDVNFVAIAADIEKKEQEEKDVDRDKKEEKVVEGSGNDDETEDGDIAGEPPVLAPATMSISNAAPITRVSPSAGV